ncbi:MAG: prolyl oligopeptidase family serine peptidase [Anaeromyxobacteraceae bacterium]
MRTVAVAACAALLACASAPPAPAPHRDGEIESLIPDSEDAFGRYLAVVYWSDGLKVKGYLGLPRTPGKHPALVVNRGGVGGVGHAEPYHLWEWAENGYVAVASFYRGVGGSEGRDGYGGADVRDVLALVPLLESLPEVDPSRIGMLGVDRGGMMTLAALAADGERGPRRFKAAITVGAATDLPALAAANPGLLAPLHAAIGGGPSEAPAAWAARSALRWPGRLAGVPLLILHGEADERVPVAQARALAEAVRKAGGDVTLEVVPGDDHGLSRSEWGVPVMVRFFEGRLK